MKVKKNYVGTVKGSVRPVKIKLNIPLMSTSELCLLILSVHDMAHHLISMKLYLAKEKANWPWNGINGNGGKLGKNSPKLFKT